jgi:N-formylglutamate deformylase
VLAERGNGMTRPRPAVLRHDPAGPVAPLVLDSPHSGEDYPDDFAHVPPRAHLRQAEDTHVARLWMGALAHGATLVEATFPRAYIDPNRHAADIDMALFAAGSAWPGEITPSRKTEQGIGLVWRLARHGVPMYAQPLAVHDVQARIDRYYAPYHAVLDALLDERQRAFGTVWHINCHSMPAVGDVHADDAGQPRADFVLGDRDGTTCAPAFTRVVRDFLAGAGYSVAVNDPYKGVEIVRRHGRPHAGRHSLQIEINRRLYMDEDTLVPTRGYAPLAAHLASLAQHLVQWAPDHPHDKIGLTT